jgi:Fe-S cluster biogenesis protein NfuA
MPNTLERIEETLDTLRPYIASHRGQVEVVDFDESEGVLLLRLGGTCSGCSASSITLRQGIEARLRQMVPEVKQVDAIYVPLAASLRWRGPRPHS